jgi:hypothetical protein
MRLPREVADSPQAPIVVCAGKLTPQSAPPLDLVQGDRR